MVTEPLTMRRVINSGKRTQLFLTFIISLLASRKFYDITDTKGITDSCRFTLDRNRAQHVFDLSSFNYV